VDVNILSYAAKWLTGGSGGFDVEGGCDKEEGGVWLCGVVENNKGGWFLFGNRPPAPRFLEEEQVEGEELGRGHPVFDQGSKESKEEEERAWKMSLFVVGDDYVVKQTHAWLEKVLGKSRWCLQRDELWAKMRAAAAGGGGGAGMAEKEFRAMCDLCSVVNIAKVHDARVGELLGETLVGLDVLLEIDGGGFSVLTADESFVLVLFKEAGKRGLFVVSKEGGQGGGGGGEAMVQAAVEEFVNKQLCRLLGW
jgi:hypothetical protein